jgi:hypothetical protein
MVVAPQLPPAAGGTRLVQALQCSQGDHHARNETVKMYSQQGTAVLLYSCCTAASKLLCQW